MDRRPALYEPGKPRPVGRQSRPQAARRGRLRIPDLKTGVRRCYTTPGGTILINLTSLIDDAKCYELIRHHRWPEGVRCTTCSSAAVIRHGHDETQRHRQRYRCKDCGARFDDLTGTVLAGHHQPLRVWVLCLYFMGLNLSNQQIAKELGLNDDDVHDMASHLREGLVAKVPEATLDGVVLAKATGQSFQKRVRTAMTGAPALEEVVGALLSAWLEMSRQIGVLERCILDTAREDEVVRRLMSAPGVGAIVALSFVSVIGTPDRFRRSDSVGVYVGLTPRRYQSGEMDYSGKISKCGDRLLRTCLYEAAGILLNRVERWSTLKA